MGNHFTNINHKQQKEREKEKEKRRERKRDLSPSDPFFLILIFAAIVGIVYVWSGKKIDSNIQQRLDNKTPTWVRLEQGAS